VHNDCQFADRQVLKLQETPECVPEGETPKNIAVCCFDDLVDQVRPGDRVEVTGIFRATAVRPLANWKMCNSVYRTSIDAIAIAAEKKGRIEADVENDDEVLLNHTQYGLSDQRDLNPEYNSQEDISWNQRVRNLAAEVDQEGKPSIVQRLIQSFAPSIFEEDDVKKGLLCMLFGGGGPIGNKTRSRPEIHTLLCGDPSTAKSQLLLYVYKLAPRGVYTSGKGSSAVGLTATINRDPMTKDLVLESGALVLSDRGVCCIDEFDKMNDYARSILHEAMEQQTVSIAKASIVCSLNARTSICACANPKDSSYNKNKSVVDNIDLPKNLMTRFDFIWLMIDKRNKELDRRLATHILAMYTEGGTNRKVQAPVDPELFRRYISFARRWVRPELTNEAEDLLIQSYSDLRNQGGSREVITATPRILESLIRISESLAKMELREEVLARDVEEAQRLLKAATYAAAVDPETGRIDMEQLIVGVGAGRRRRAKDIESLIGQVLAEQKAANQVVTTDNLRRLMNEELGRRNEQLLGETEFNAAVRTAEIGGLLERRGKQLELI